MRLILLLPLLFLTVRPASQKLVLATYQYADNDRLENIRPLSTYLSDSLGLEVEIKSYPSVHQFIEGIQQNEVDIALINTFGYLLLETSTKNYGMKPAVVLQVQEGAADNYKTAFLVRTDFPIDSLKDLKSVASNYRLGLVSPGSTSGNLLPRLKMAAIGIESPESIFKTVEYCQNHKNTVDMLLDGRIDICAVGSTEYFSLFADKNKAQLVKLLWLSSEIPLGPVLLHNRLSKNIQQQITNHLLKLDRESPATLEAIKAGWSEAKQAYRYVEIDQHYYTPFKNQFGDEKNTEGILKQFAN